jgi:hypothetical protein
MYLSECMENLWWACIKNLRLIRRILIFDGITCFNAYWPLCGKKFILGDENLWKKIMVKKNLQVTTTSKFWTYYWKKNTCLFSLNFEWEGTPSPALKGNNSYNWKTEMRCNSNKYSFWDIHVVQNLYISIAFYFKFCIHWKKKPLCKKIICFGNW